MLAKNEYVQIYIIRSMRNQNIFDLPLRRKNIEWNWQVIILQSIRIHSFIHSYIKTVLINAQFLFHFIFKEARCRWETTIFPCRMVSGNEIKLCLKYFCLPIYFVHFEISLTFISPKPSPKPSDVQLLSTRHVTKFTNLIKISSTHFFFCCCMYLQFIWYFMQSPYVYYVYMPLRGPFNLDQ
jgi:hypothetical protein